tara:strand:+ start:368 stop:1075 length:708 start_codon:yes stop_codon:yes gene_type:complete
MKLIDDNSIDFILTDLPYGTTQYDWDKQVPVEEMWSQIKRIRKDRTAIALFGLEPFSSFLRLSNIEEYRYDWIWEKDKGTGQAFSKKQPMRKNENISIFYKEQPDYDWQGEKLAKPITRVRTISGGESFSTAKKNLENGRRKYVTYTHRTKHNMLYFPRDNQKKNQKSYHPTQKPVALLEYLIETYTLEDQTVLDFTMGSGSTGVACVNTNRNFIGIEIQEKYSRIAKERIENYN